MKMNYFANKQKLLPGIYGGMGPLSHIKFEEHLLTACHQLNIQGDQNIPTWILFSGSSTPDRTKSIQQTGPISVSHLVYFTKQLESFGCDFVVIACNTAHHYFETIKKSLYIPIVSMIDETVKEITTNYKGVRKVGLMATNGTIESNLYQEAFAKIGVSVITPKIHDPIQKNIMRAIYDKDYGIKETGTRLDTKACKILLDGAYRLRHQGAEVIISGCTEISLAFERTNFDIPIIDPLKITAYKTIAVAMGIEKLPRTNLGEISSPNVLTQFSKIFRSDNSSHNLI
ncbi:MAG: Aspartate racemase [Candidatus Woesebacteria bacterium GW2011_GWA2_40_7]|uniref:Aspartate racemase n=3 Tax=Candidatus Woeseibacteriota TaxID=1752722 RepID=A0A0G0UV83_9BACT|nr:MAG: Aspartate racemase [Candidatus Woesebacteria bacterium GW2011_GWB1_39_10]KKR74259.1 MAG: Aspartate racemase [Candidatus Woesebacteria bacterium GW2011_GWA2_40_7]KKR92634.1 MAG: Aspartate racemase [Candidatus Woesebacteria bacterium GW2011_GWA1_41_13b]